MVLDIKPKDQACSPGMYPLTVFWSQRPSETLDKDSQEGQKTFGQPTLGPPGTHFCREVDPCVVTDRIHLNTLCPGHSASLVSSTTRLWDLEEVQKISHGNSLERKGKPRVPTESTHVHSRKKHGVVDTIVKKCLQTLPL